MTVQQFADEQLQLEREKQKEASVKDSVIVSTDQEFERRRRGAMANVGEAWRDGSLSTTANDATHLAIVIPETTPTVLSDLESPSTFESAFASSSNDFDDENDRPLHDDEMNENNAEFDETLSTELNAYIPDDEGNILLSMIGKRTNSNSNDDNDHRINHHHHEDEKQVKRARLDVSIDTSGEGGTNLRSAEPSPSHRKHHIESSPRASGSTSLLKMLKENATTTTTTTTIAKVAVQSQREEESLSPKVISTEKDKERVRDHEKDKERSSKQSSHNSKPSFSRQSSAAEQQPSQRQPVTQPGFKLVNKDATDIVTITRPGGIVLKASGLVNDK
jgi:hypothetical protein